MNDTAISITGLLHGPDRTGLVAKVSGWIFERGSNILHADQHRDSEASVFFQRVEWKPSDGSDPASEAKAFSAFARDELGMHVQTALSSHRPRVALFVSKIEHCFHDFILRWRAGEFPCEISCVISNHSALKTATEQYGLPFYHIPVKKDNKVQAEAEQVRIVKEHGIELIVLTRYMQILTADFIGKAACPIINIHHSFLPAFAGARPYHQAFHRGVKLIGATAHYVTPVLDDGPIIQQEVAHVNHRHTVPDLIRKGRDLEKMVLSQAVRWHLECRILTYANKTVVFD